MPARFCGRKIQRFRRRDLHQQSTWITSHRGLSVCARAQDVTFDFDNVPLYAPLPLDITPGGVTGHFSSGSPWYNYSIQPADVLGFAPQGFSGLCIFRSTVFQSDLSVSFLNNQISKERWADKVLGNRLISICHFRSAFGEATADRFQICDCAQLTHFNWTPHGRTRYLNFRFAFARQ